MVTVQLWKLYTTGCMCFVIVPTQQVINVISCLHIEWEFQLRSWKTLIIGAMGLSRRHTKSECGIGAGSRFLLLSWQVNHMSTENMTHLMLFRIRHIPAVWSDTGLRLLSWYRHNMSGFNSCLVKSSGTCGTKTVVSVHSRQIGSNRQTFHFATQCILAE